MKHTTRKDVPVAQLQRAKAMRNAMTPPERKLWRALRERLPLEKTHFRRQVSIGPYITDFYCLAARLVIEVDGNQHGTDNALRFDARRAAHLETHGFRVLRFSNHDVNTALDSVLDTIFAAFARTPTPGPSPQGGGEETHFHG